MKVIDAFWEKRNLGVSTMEIILEKGDREEEFLKLIDQQEYEYCVVKLPIDAIAFNTVLEKNGFVFAESMNHIYHDLDLKELNGKKKEIVANTTIEKAENLESIFEQISKGMFSTDRIALDDRFGKEVAATRYINWIKDELQRGSEIYKYFYKGEEFGFSAIKETEVGVYHEFLYGIYNAYAGKGMSVNMPYKLTEVVTEKGGKMLTTDVSSNNIASLKSKINNGYKFDYSMYVFVKHKNQ